MIQRSDEAKAGKVIGSTGGRQEEEVDAETANSLFSTIIPTTTVTQALCCAEG